MGEIKIPDPIEAGILKVVNHAVVVGSGFGDDTLCPGFIQKQIMHQGGQPASHFVRATMVVLPDQHVDAAIM